MMKSKVFAVLAGTAVALSAAAAMAAPLPSPPWVPQVACPFLDYDNEPMTPDTQACAQAVPDKDALKVSAAFGKLVSKGTQGGLKCFAKGVSNIFNGKGDPDGDLATCNADNLTKLLTSGAKTIAKLADPMKPTAQYVPCATTNALGVVQPTMTALIPDLLPVALCDGTTNIGVLGYGTASTISGTDSMLPTTKDIMKTELAVIAASGKFGTAYTKCLDKGVANILKAKGNASGDADLCLADVDKGPGAKLTATLTKIGTKAGGIPACLWGPTGQANLAAGAAKIGQTLSLVDSLLYCNS